MATFFETLFCLEDINPPPRFTSRVILDENPVSGHVRRRIIYMPNSSMRRLHAALVRCIRQHWTPPAYVIGAVKGGSPLKNALWHKGNQYFFLLDLKDAYGLVNGAQLSRILANVVHDWREQALQLQEALEAHFLGSQGGLVVGAPASPDLFNLYVWQLLDTKLEEMLNQWGIRYSRYLDDLTFSASHPITRHQRTAIRELVSTQGFRINDRKAQILDLSKGPITLCGVGIAPTWKLFLPRHYLRRLKGLLHHVLTKPHDREALRPLIAGTMGVFVGCTRKPYTTGEQNVLTMWRNLRRQNRR